MGVQEYILVVDDQDNVRSLMKEALKTEGYRVETAEDGSRAIEMLAQNNHYALVITDLIMPKVSGLDVLTEIKKHIPTAEVILVTAHGSLETAVAALREGAHDYIVKPFELKQLIHSVQRTLIYRRLKLEKANLLTDLKQQSLQQKAILKASNQLAHLSNHSTLPLDKIVGIITRTLNLPAAITAFDQNGQLLQTQIAPTLCDFWKDLLANRLPSNLMQFQSLFAEARQLSQSHFFRFGFKIYNSSGEPNPAQDTSQTPLLAIPLIGNNGPTIGIMWLAEIGQSPSIETVQSFEILANQVTGTLENISFSISRSHQIHVRNTLVEAGQRIATVLDRQEVLKTILDATLKVMPKVEQAIVYYNLGKKPLPDFMGLTHQKQTITTSPLAQSRILDVVTSKQTTYLPDWKDSNDATGKSLIIEPLTLGGVSLGVLAIIGQVPYAFPDDYRQVLTMLSSQAAIALQNARLYAEARRVDELGALVEAGQAINRNLDLRETLKTTLTVTRDLTGALISNIYLYTPERNRIDSVITLGEETSLSDEDRRWSSDIAWEALQRNEPLLMPKSAPFPDSDEGEEIPASLRTPSEAHTIQTWLAVPLATGETPIGVLLLGSEQPNLFTPDDPQLIQVIAAQAATAIENARLYEEVERRLQQTEVLGAITQSISTTLNLHQVLKLVVHSAVKTIAAATHSTLYMLDKNDGSLQPEAEASAFDGELPTDIDTIRQQVIKETVQKLKPVRLTWQSDYVEHSPWTLLAIPLRVGNSVIGAISVESPHTNSFPDNDQALLNTFASHASVAIQNANLFRDLSSAYVDLTRQQEEVLRTNRTLQALFDGITDGLYIVDQDLKAIAINQAEAKRLGTTQQALIGKPCDESVWGEATAAVTKIVRNTFKTGNEVNWESAYEIYELTDAADRGPFTDRDVRTYPIFSESGEVTQVIIFAQDISEKRRLQATLFRSANLASIGQLASSIAHEINNPLTVVIANSQVLQMDADPADPDLALIEYILEGGMRIQRIVQNLLDFSTQDRYEWFRIDLESTINDALVLIAAPLRKSKIEVVKEIDSLPGVIASPNHLKLVWMNLLLNARDAISRREDAQGIISIKCTQLDSKRVQIKIIDNGSGIAAQYRNRLFLPFFTTKSPGKGPGLGLYTCQTIIERHQGQIELNNTKKGHGAIVTVTLLIEPDQPTP